jgi:hypothetical protein
MRVPPKVVTRFMFLRNATAEPSAGSAFHHVGSSVPDLDATMEKPEAAGVKITTSMLEVDPTNGRREGWADIQPQDPAGIMSLNLATWVTTPDGRGYGYTWRRVTSDLFLVRGWS